MFFKTRSQFTEGDFAFIAETLKTSAPDGSTAGLRSPDDLENVTEMLHDRRLFERSITTPPLFLTVSPQLYFYLFIYRALDSKNLADDDVVDYVAGVCVEFRSSDQLWSFASAAGEKIMTMVDMLNMLPEVGKAEQYYLRRYIGNVSLFLTGFFPDFIFQRSQQKGAPPLTYYERIGRAQYETAASGSEEYESGVRPVLSILADEFVAVRSALNIFTDNYLNLHNDKYALRRIERQAATLDDESFQQSLLH
ncbi:MAG TPA: hypothetical protein VLY03_12075 [Bacteroidota bacterium]|nr:hypothetical protein [Bacteroidota bacterium]